MIKEENARWVHECGSDEAFEKIEFQAEFIPAEVSGPIVLKMPPYDIRIADDCLQLPPYNRRVANLHQSYIGWFWPWSHNWLARSGELRFIPAETNCLTVRYAAGVIRVSLNGKVFEYKSKYKPGLVKLEMEWPGGTIVQKMEIIGKRTTCKPIPPAPKYDYHLTVDFPDDIIPAAVTRPMLDQMMKNIAEMGVKRVNWIYYGGVNSGFWDPTGGFALPDGNVKKTFAELGPDDLATAVAAARKYNLEIYAVIKPFDYNILGWTLAPGSAQFKKYGKCDVLGGKTYWGDNFAFEHPELCFRRRSCLPATKSDISRMEIASIRPLTGMAGKIRLWESLDNRKYRLYKGPMRVNITEDKIVLQDLRVSAPFLAVQLVNEEGEPKIINTLDALIKVFDEKGLPIECTYGLEPRKFSKRMPGVSHLDPAKQIGGDFRQYGFFFDCAPFGIPSEVYAGDRIRNELFSLDNHKPAFGLARGKNQFIPGLMCPSEPLARKYWINLIKKALDCGVDGIDIREQGHNNALEWSEYGFNEPVVKEFKKRYGIDIRKEEFPRDKLRELRGEFYTGFLRKAGDEVRKHGKKMQLHVEDILEGTSDMSCPMEIFWDWQTWIKEGLADGITFRALNADSLRTPFGRALVRQCQKKRLPVYFQPFLQGITGRPDWRDFLSNTIRNSGVSGLVVYEYSFIFVAQPDGRFLNQQKAVTDFISELTGSRKNIGAKSGG